MKAITFKAPQSHLRLEQSVFKPVFKSVFKSRARRRWLRLNLAIRSISRRACGRHGNALLGVTAVAAVGCFFAAVAENYGLTAILALAAMAASAPEIAKLSYEPLNDEKGGEA